MKGQDTPETICAVSTPIGEGGIGVVRLSGPAAVEVVDRLFRSLRPVSLKDVPSHTMHPGRIVHPATGATVDEVIVSVMRAPRSYTREDVVEINAHGSPVLLREILDLAVRQGARIAAPGEFTRRAFLNGRIDLSKAEAVMEVIQAKTEASSRAAMERLEGALGREIHHLREQLRNLLAVVEAAIDFPEEDLEIFPRDEAAKQVDEISNRVRRMIGSYEEGRILRDGLATVIVGRPNVGKSSLLNCLLRQDRAIVSPVPGTTRDLLEEYLNIKGVPLRIVDTAGLRTTEDPVEQEGLKRAQTAISRADLLLVVIEAPAGLMEEESRLIAKHESDKRIVLVINKVDLAPEAGEALREKMDGKIPAISFSATRGQGLDLLREAIRSLALSSGRAPRNDIIITEVRHKAALCATEEHLAEVLKAVKEGMPEEMIAVDLHGALDQLGEIIGVTTCEEILDRIFSTFCIGK